MSKKPEPFKKPEPDNSGDFINELGTALMMLTRALGRRHMTLASIDLGSWDDGQHFKMNVDREHAFYIEQGIDNRTGEMVNQGNVAGVLIRWPTKRKALRDSEFGGPKNRFRYL